ncbi:glycoside hydrolase family 5 protein [Planosporangium thailandense]|uniref:glycoside hydrolase family 5 protein n=1 Tax=Planosporangium thailandense TaxID=765197 RepID=UPI00197B5B79|nr:glycoside hydrolase family 5 protein [Planosporangium thailandense]
MTSRLRVRKPVLYTSVLATLLAIAAAFSIPTFTAGKTVTGTGTGDARPQAVGNGIVAPLHAQGGKLVDARGKVVQLTGINWFGMETGTFAPHGLWSRNWQQMLDQIAAQGFNTLRLPYSNELFLPGSKPNGIDFHQNPDLQGLTGQQIMDKIVSGATSRGMMVFLDQHRPDQYGQSALWYSDKVSEETWLKDWTNLAARYKNNPLVIGADLHNEPRGEATWGDGNEKTDWRLAAERAGNAILKVNPNWLIIVEGVENYKNKGYWWGGNLQGAMEYPVRLSDPSKLVYSAHDYGPGVYNQNWFTDKDFPKNMPAIWDQMWGNLAKSGKAPVIMGEFGGKTVDQKETEGVWQHALIDYLKQNGLSYTYWCWNPDSGDTGGVLTEDWNTIDKAKMDMLKSYQAPMAAKPGNNPA